jgi:DNA excision repair protein ERCC-4
VKRSSSANSTLALPEFGVAVDSREQRPWTFGDSVPVLTKALPAGDYAPLGFESQCAIERKSIGDFVGCITYQRERFVRELERLKTYSFACIVIEANLSDVFERRYRSRVHPSSVVGSAVAFSVDYSVPVFWASNPEHAGDLALRILKRWWVNAHEPMQALKEAS